LRPYASDGLDQAVMEGEWMLFLCATRVKYLLLKKLELARGIEPR